MDKDLLLLVVGAIIGLVSAAVIELIRQFFEKKKIEREREYHMNQAREKDLREFHDTGSQNRKPHLAWLRLVNTKSVPLLKRLQGSKGTSRSVSNRSSLRRARTHALSPLFLVFYFIRKFRFFSKAGNDEEKPTINKFILGKTQFIGRQQDCEIRLDDLAVSRHHAVIRFDEGKYVIYDLGSTSKTYVNDKKIPTSGQALSNGDEITMGESIFIFEETGPKVEKRFRVSKRISNEIDLTSNQDTKKINKKKESKKGTTVRRDKSP